MRFKVFSHLKQLFEVTQHTAWGLCFHSCGNSSKAFPLGLGLCCVCRRVVQTLDNFRKGRMKLETVIFDEVEPKKWTKINKWSTLESALPRWAIYLRLARSPWNLYVPFRRETQRWNITLCLYGSIFMPNSCEAHKTEWVYGQSNADTRKNLRDFFSPWHWNLSRHIPVL